MTIIKKQAIDPDEDKPYYPGPVNNKQEKVQDPIRRDDFLSNKEADLAKQQLEQKWKLVPSFLKVRGLGVGFSSKYIDPIITRTFIYLSKQLSKLHSNPSHIIIL